MAAMGEMIGNIAHQWRQPLSVISTIAGGIRFTMDFGAFDKKTTISDLEKIVDVTQHLSKTIDDFRDFFSPNKEMRHFLLEDAFSKNMHILGTTFRHRSIEIVKDIKEVYVDGYLNELTQALLNVLNNAKDALEKIESEKYLFVKIYKKDEFAVISIKDNAGGIPDDIIGHIFEPYFTTKHKSQGTGIGLYMSEQIIVKHMKGSFNVRNAEYEFEGKKYSGAEFIIEIPVKANTLR